MKFREQLNKANELGLSPIDLEIANECDCIFDFEYTADEFEKLCLVALEAYLEFADICAWSLARAIADIINEGKAVAEVVKMSKWDILHRAYMYD